MGVKEVAADMAELFKADRGHEVGAKYWSDDVVSIEPMMPGPMDPVSRGRKAVEGKSEWWVANHETENVTTEGPFINGDKVAFRFEMDVKVKATGAVMHMTEVGLYTIKDDKIVEERFLYGV